MLQRNVSGYPLLVQPPDGSHLHPVELAAGDTIDWPTPITGCAAIPPGPPLDESADDGPAPTSARAARKKTTDPAPAADGGDPA